MRMDEVERSKGEWGWRGGQSRFSGRVTDPRLQRALQRLERISGADSSGELLVRAPGVRIDAVQAPASADQIAEAELRLGTAVPMDYSRFLLRWNGMTLTLPAAGGRRLPGEICLLGTDHLVRLAEELEGRYSTACIPELLLFATVGAAGDHLAFATGRLNPLGGCAVLDARHDRHPERWWVIARDFAAWLDALLRPGRGASAAGRDWNEEREELQPSLPFEEADDLDLVDLSA